MGKNMRRPMKYTFLLKIKANDKNVNKYLG